MDQGGAHGGELAEELNDPVDFNLKALYRALDQQRQARGLSWAAATLEINRGQTPGHPIAASTIRGLEQKPAAEADGVLQMLRWLDRTPESFVPGFADASAQRFQLPRVRDELTLRFNVPAIHAALEARRGARGISWTAVAREIGGFTPGMLTRLKHGSRIGFPGVMRIAAWLEEPASSFVVAR